MGRSQSTLSRELTRNTGERGYRHKQAMRLAQERHALKPKQIKLTETVKDQIISLISQDWNPEQISGWVDIENRPEIANQRGRFGDWEADTIIGKNHKGAIVTLDERKSKLRLAAPLQGKKAQLVTEQ